MAPPRGYGGARGGFTMEKKNIDTHGGAATCNEYALWLCAMNGVNTDRNGTTNHQKESSERTMRCYRWWNKEDGRMNSTKDSSGSSKPN
ncbi:His Kinase A [Sesbania bispinosa]|nr:His Kinase A [Sesbania bispinosa]